MTSSWGKPAIGILPSGLALTRPSFGAALDPTSSQFNLLSHFIPQLYHPTLASPGLPPPHTHLSPHLSVACPPPCLYIIASQNLASISRAVRAVMDDATTLVAELQVKLAELDLRVA